jgi:hypothetical protein
MDGDIVCEGCGAVLGTFSDTNQRPRGFYCGNPSLVGSCASTVVKSDDAMTKRLKKLVDEALVKAGVKAKVD